MKISISVADRPGRMPQIMFAGPLGPICAKLAALGFDGIDLFFPEPPAADVAAARTALAESGLKAAMLSAQGDLMAEGLFLNRPGVLPRLLEGSRRHLAMCAELGAKSIVGFFRGQHKDVPGGREESLKCMAEGVAAYCGLAETFGVGVLLEPINRYEMDSIHTVAEALALRERAGAPGNLSILPDVFHMHIEESSLAAAIARAAGHIGHVHFVDNTRAVPGLGCLALGALAECLGVAGYDGFLGMEAVPGPDPEDEARAGLATVRALLSRPALRGE
ncbi:MAG: sugar phosphate isomerase/epimerase [Desulfovibrio sp.]|uniref:sugar phosphate isomerase/epimerase family protein n=1 Tax=Desulfovibrio sp. TaxID=885 RepID=UPI001A6F04B2|nr:sugar phosphate isomerase/epimerase [Desulfovibrio sp.]MBD5416469.1 sugar phosphate isomerase/epimerase [Desulfovibrio sp.]